MRKRIVGLFASLVLVDGATTAHTPQGKPAILVEAHSTHRCVGLDCPPWPMPLDSDFCFQAGESFYTGTYYPFGVPWARKGEKLLLLEGKTVEIVVTDRFITVVAPQIKLRLKRVHDDPIFRLVSCSHN